jgi:hypothetical protein
MSIYKTLQTHHFFTEKPTIFIFSSDDTGTDTIDTLKTMALRAKAVEKKIKFDKKPDLK